MCATDFQAAIDAQVPIAIFSTYYALLSCRLLDYIKMKYRAERHMRPPPISYRTREQTRRLVFTAIIRMISIFPQAKWPTTSTVAVEFLERAMKYSRISYHAAIS